MISNILSVCIVCPEGVGEGGVFYAQVSAKIWNKFHCRDAHSYCSSGRRSQISVSFPFSVGIFFLMNAVIPTAWNPIFRQQKHSQLPFYPFRTLSIPLGNSRCIFFPREIEKNLDCHLLCLLFPRYTPFPM